MWNLCHSFSIMGFFKFFILVVLDVVHDLGDTVLVSLEQGAGHNWVQAVNKNLSRFLSHKKKITILMFSFEQGAGHNWVQAVEKHLISLFCHKIDNY